MFLGSMSPGGVFIASASAPYCCVTNALNSVSTSSTLWPNALLNAVVSFAPSA